MILLKKILRDAKKNLVPYFSIIFLSMSAISCFCGLTSSNIGIERDREAYHEDTNLADYWIYGNFTEEDADVVKEEKEIQNVQLRTKLDTYTEDEKLIYLYIEDKNEISKPYVVEGSSFDTEDVDGIWLNSRFAEENDIHIGDPFVLEYNSERMEKEIRGFIMSAEYEYYKAAEDTQPNFGNIGFAYIAKCAWENAEQLPATQMIINAKTDDKSKIDQIASSKLEGKYSVVYKRSDIEGIQSLTEEVDQHKAFAFIFPVVFVGIAIMIIISTMSRVISEARIQIGTMKALGVKKGRILSRYLAFAFLLSLIGSVIGLVVGIVGVGAQFGAFMAMSYTMPSWGYGFSPYFLVAVMVLVVLSVLSAYFSCRKIINMNTRDILYPRAPKSVKKCIFERFPFWDKLKFSLQYNLRNMTRNKLRNFTVVIGVVGGILLTMSALGCVDTLDYMKKWSFEKINQYNYKVTFKNDVTEDYINEVAEEIDGELLMSYVIEVRKDEDTEKINGNISVIDGKGYLNVTDLDTEVYELKKGEVAISKSLAKKLNAEVGDQFQWKMAGRDEWITSEIGSINRVIEGKSVTMLKSTFEKEDIPYRATACFTKKDLSDYENDNVDIITSKDKLKEAWDHGVSMYYFIIFIFLVLAILMLFIVVYNSAVLSFNERMKEFATLRVMGIKKKGLRKIMIQQNVWMTIIGAIIGMPFGKLVLRYMFNSNGDGQDFAVRIYPLSFLLSFVIVVCCSYVINLFFAKSIKKIDMAECMKASE